MKKYFALAALAMVAIVACNKEIENKEEVIPEVKPKGEVTIFAQAPSETKTMVDDLAVKWASGDHIGVVDNNGDMHDFTLDSGEGTATGAFSGSLGGNTSGGYAVYPYTANAAFDGDFTVDYPTTYAYNAVTVPMWGEEGTGANVGKYTFNHIGGAFKIQYTNVPSGASKFVFTSTSNITGTTIYDLTDAVIVSNEGKVVTVTSLPSSSTLTFIIPVPAGSYSFSVKLLDGSEDVIAGSEKTVSSAKTVAEGHVVPLKAIKVKADKKATLWSEDFESYAANDQPSQSSATVFWGGNASYAYTSTDYCKVYTGGTLGSNELLIPKSTRAETWVVSNIPTGHWDGMTLTYKSNQNISVTSSDVTVGDATNDAGTYTRTITGADGLAFFSLTFAMTTDSNARIDDIVLTAGEPEPGITVSTVAASATSTVAGTTATLNGSLALINGAVNSSVTEAGFYYKLTGAGSYTKVTCASAPTSTTSFSYNLTSLTTNSEYTYYAYAIYDGGSEVKGDATEKTFTPTLSGVFSPVSFSFSRSGSSNTITSGFAIVVENGKANADNYQDKNSTVGLDLYFKKSDDSALFTSTPTSISITVKVGGGSAKDPLANEVLAYLVDSKGDNIAITETAVTDKVETTTGKAYTVSIPVTSPVYGLRISHAKESSYNVRIYEVSFTAS